jgi:hypothetical protein
VKKNSKLAILSLVTGAVLLTSTVPVDKTTNNFISGYYDVLLDDITNEYTFVSDNVNYVPKDNYVPQGIAIVDDYVLTSNFDYYKENNSIICVFDKDSNLINKCILEHDAHVGGIAYDEVNKLLFVTAYNGYVYAYDIDDILTNSKCEAKYNNLNVGSGLPNYLYYWINSASFVTMHNEELLVGNFSLRREGKVKRYKYEIIEDKVVLEYIGSFLIPDMVQGVTFYTKDDVEYIMFSRSYGRDCSSILQIFKYDESITSYRDEDLVSVSLKLCPMLEQITIKDNELYLLFESNAKPYVVRQDKDFDSIAVFAADEIVKKLELKIDTN